MAFVMERISEEDKAKFGENSIWAIDRIRGLFLSIEHFAPQENLMRFRLRSYEDGKLLIKVDAKYQPSGSPEEGFLIWYDLFNFFILDEEMLKKKEESKAILFEAITEYGSARPNERFKNYTVKIT